MELITNASLSRITFWGIGGNADELYYIDDIQELPEIWAETLQSKIPFFVLGKGSNTCLSDKGLRGRAFVFRDKEMVWHPDGRVTLSAGVEMQKAIEESNKRGYADWCQLSGIPGVLGGWIRGNAGAFGSEIGDSVLSVDYCNEHGEIKTIQAKDANFTYRHSLFKDKPEWCIMRATFLLQQTDNPDEALSRTKELFKKRWQKYPKGRSGGSFFKNPEGDFSGRLLEKNGAKGDTVGAIQISEDHANFVLNTGKGKQTDLLHLMQKWQKIILEKEGIKLIPEVNIVDEYGKTIRLEAPISAPPSSSL